MKQIDDSVFEALFRQAIIADYNEEIDSIPPKERLMEIISFSPEFEVRMKKLFTREKQKDLFRKVLKYGKQAAAVFVVATTVVFGMLLFNSEVRAAIKNTAVEWYDKFTSFIFQGDSDTNEKTEWQPEYLPTGYRENSNDKLGKATNIEYINDHDDTIYLSYRPEGNNTNISVDNENHLVESETINGHEAYIAKATNDDFENGVIWNMEGYTFSIWSKLPIEELIKVAQSIY
ncbi:MAG: hypothetical protein K0R46_2306 [Herbinix sp.]|jgi:c-di-AMP phosphodiesterase-like protein|nr:hypothetical protein [Herbinix sp.]